nr:MAG TPA: secretion system protein [Caudoviricetes sp.]
MKGKKTAAAMAMIAAIILTGWAEGNAGAEEAGEKRIPVMVEEGDTIWDLCRKVATDRDNLGRMAYYTMVENNITEPGSIQPGTVITIVVPER